MGFFTDIASKLKFPEPPEGEFWFYPQIKYWRYFDDNGGFMTNKEMEDIRNYIFSRVYAEKQQIIEKYGKVKFHSLFLQYMKIAIGE